jgi:signal transduction histidine kinase
MTQNLEALQAELDLLRSHDAATAEVLRIINNSSGDLERVLEAIAGVARRLCDAELVFVVYPLKSVSGEGQWMGWRNDQGSFSMPPEAIEPTLQRVEGLRRVQVVGRLQEIAGEHPELAAIARDRGREEISFLNFFMAQARGAHGFINVWRFVAEPFTSAQVTLLERLTDQALIAIENTRLIRELRESDDRTREALDVQRVMAEVLGVVAGAPSDLRASLPAIGEAAKRLTDSNNFSVCVNEGERVLFISSMFDSIVVTNEEVNDWLLPENRTVSLVAMFENRTVEVCGPIDSWAGEYQRTARTSREVAGDEAAVLAVPLPSGMEHLGAAGSITVGRRGAAPYSEDHRRILRTLADQAMIAIQNARLFGELQKRNAEITEALRREEAGSAILRQISESPEQLDETLQIITAAAQRLTGMSATLALIEGDRVVRRGLAVNSPDEIQDTVGNSRPLTEYFRHVMRTRAPVAWTQDVGFSFEVSAEAVAEMEAGVQTYGVRAAATVPLKRSEAVIGFLSIANNTGTPIGVTLIALLETFADQASIAIENARLLRELRESDARTREALDVQRVMGQVLSVVAGAPSNLDSSLPEIAAAAKQLTFADTCVMQVIDGNQVKHWGGVWGGNAYDIQEFTTRMLEFEHRIMPSVAMAENRIIEFTGSVEALRAEYPEMARQVDKGLGGLERSYLAVPLPALQGSDGASGALLVARVQATPFTEAQRTILLTLADQAVIALQNARLFGELEARNKEITEALRREEAGSAILRQISESPEKLEETLQAITEACLALTGCSTSIWIIEGDEGVFFGAARAAHDVRVVHPMGKRVPMSEEVRLVLHTKAPSLHRLETLLSDELDGILSDFEAKRLESAALVPVIRAGEVTALLTLVQCDETVLPLVQTFANQAAIAIENARLIRELRERNQNIYENLERQTVMRNVLAIVASAPSDLEATLPPISAAAKNLCEVDSAVVCYRDGSVYRVWGDDFGRGHRVHDVDTIKELAARGSIPYMAIVENRSVEVVGSAEALAIKYPRILEMNPGRAEFAILSLPMPGRDGPIGSITVFRYVTRPFTERQRQILEALANQAVIAVENARLFNQLKEKSEELEIASRHKSEFLANMSHELRTPLNAIIGYAELLQEECEDLGQQEFMPDLGKIHSAGKHLLTLISGILDLSKVEAGRMTMFLEDFDITTLIRDADAIVRPMVEKNRNTFMIDCPEDIGTMHADLVKVRQVLFNLLSNSAKFTEGGTITLTVRTPVDDTTVSFAIHDTGIGMTEAQLDRLFEAFSQASAETSRKYGGTGLGLALSREFCRMLGGDIAVESVAGEGSTFTVTLPVKCVDAEIAS